MNSWHAVNIVRIERRPKGATLYNLRKEIRIMDLYTLILDAIYRFLKAIFDKFADKELEA